MAAMTAFCVCYRWYGEEGVTTTTRAFYTLEDAEAFVEHGMRVWPYAFEPVWIDERVYRSDTCFTARFIVEDFTNV